MSENESFDQHIDHILSVWDFGSSELVVRRTKGSDGRDVIQMRIDMGVLQLEVDDRPDGATPEGFPTVLHWLRAESDKNPDLVLQEEQFAKVDREFVQFYHRRISWLQLREYSNAIRDADHTLALMDFCRKHCDNQDWILSHEQFRPFVIFHRTQADALEKLGDDENGEAAVQAVNEGLARIRAFFESFFPDESYEDDDLVQALVQMQEDLRKKYDVERTLQERLRDAVDEEKYELAAKLRDELERRNLSN